MKTGCASDEILDDKGFEAYPWFSYQHTWGKEGAPEPPSPHQWMAGLFIGSHGYYTQVEAGQKFGPDKDLVETYGRGGLTMRQFGPLSLLQGSAEFSYRPEDDRTRTRLNLATTISLVDSRTWQLLLGGSLGYLLPSGESPGAFDAGGQLSAYHKWNRGAGREPWKTGFDVSGSWRPQDPFVASSPELFSIKGGVSLFDFFRIAVEYHKITGENLGTALPASETRDDISGNILHSVLAGGAMDRSHATPQVQPSTWQPARPSPELKTAHPFFDVQRALGNRTFGRVLQAKVAVGPAGDVYEQEADRVAERIMTMPDPRAQKAADPGERTPGPEVQRVCTGCEEEVRRQPEEGEEREDEQIQLQRATPETVIRRQAEEEMKPRDEEEEIQPKLADSAGIARRQTAGPEEDTDEESQPDGIVMRRSKPGPASTANDIEEESLRTGGSPLTEGTRTFYEDRFDRDFSGVRVHTGAESDGRNDQLHALAFTYGNHVWMGRQQPAEPSTLLAHELAHVVQQQQPARLSRKRKGSGASSPTTPARIQRFAPYWEPYEFNGSKNHSLVLPAIGKLNSIFTEGPVPNANRLSSGYGQKGSADFYKADRTVGVYFPGDNTPQYLPQKGTLKNGGEYEHKTESAPLGSKLGAPVKKAAQGPPDIHVGDLKPSHGTIEAVEGTPQVQSYLEGFNLAHKEVNQPGSLADGKWPTLTTGLLNSGDLKMPVQFQHPGFKGQAARKLVLKHGGKKFDFQPNIIGHISVSPDPTNVGIWNYVWVPKNPPNIAALPHKIRDLGPEIQAHIVNPLLVAPVAAKKKSKDGPPAVSAAPAPVVRRKGPPIPKVPPDPFQYPKWKEKHEEYTKKLGQESKTKEYQDAEKQILAAEAQQAIKSKAGLGVPEIPNSAEPVRTLNKIEFWTGVSSAPFGLFRKVFGKAFVTLAQFFLSAKAKISEALKKKRSSSGKSGLAGAAVKSGFKVLKAVASFVISRVFDRLMESLVTGVTEKLNSYLAGETRDELERKLEEVKKLQEEIEKKALDTVEALLDKNIGPYMEKLKVIEDVHELVTDFVGLVNLVRWGARVIACLSPPGWGCLWLLLEAAIEAAAARLAETCWFQQKITPLIAGIKFVADLPKQIGDFILDKIRAFLPASLHDVFAKLDNSPIKATKDDIECDRSSDGDDAIDPEREALLELQQRLGERKFIAFMKLMQKAGVSQGKKATVEDIEKAGDIILESGVTAEQMEKFLEQYPLMPDDTAVKLNTFIDRVKTGTSPGGGAGAAGGGAPETSGSGGSGGGDGTDEGGGGGKEIVVGDAKDRPFSVKDPKVLPNATYEIVNASLQHTGKATPKLTVIGFWKGEAVVMVRDIETVVKTRKYLPKGSDDKTAQAFKIFYTVTQEKGVSLAPIPGEMNSRVLHLVEGVYFGNEIVRLR